MSSKITQRIEIHLLGALSPTETSLQQGCTCVTVLTVSVTPLASGDIPGSLCFLAWREVFGGLLAASGSACPLLHVASGQEEPASPRDKPVGVFIAALNQDPLFFTIIYMYRVDGGKKFLT